MACRTSPRVLRLTRERLYEKGGPAVSRNALVAEMELELHIGTPHRPDAVRVPEESLRPLFECWQRERDQRARSLLVERYMPLARGLARRYLGTQEPIDDLIQVAYLGLIKAIDRFDPARGNRFAAYAVPTILGELRRHFRDTAWAVHVPRSGQERAMEVERANEALTSKLGRAPTVGEIAQFIERDHEEVLDALQVSRARGSASLDAPRPGGSDEELEPRSETIGADDDGYALVEDSDAVAHALASLSPRERRVVRLRFQREMTQSQIAVEVGLSQMQISRILRHALECMRAVVDGDESEPAGRAAPGSRAGED
jgi:RNA polymerase sigma-B factor